MSTARRLLEEHADDPSGLSGVGRTTSGLALLIEDDDFDAQRVGRLLRQASGSWELRWVDTLEAGIKELASSNPDVIRLDLHLPDSQGIESLWSVAKVAPNSAIVVLTGAKDEELAARVVREGAHDYLNKDEITETALPRALRHAIERKSHQRALLAAEQRFLQLRKAQAIGQLAGGIAHEINTPMQFIGDGVQFLGSALEDLQSLIDVYRQTMAQEALSDASREAIRLAEEEADLDYSSCHAPQAVSSIRQGIERVSNIVRAVEEFAAPDQREKARCDLNEVVRACLDVARREYPGRVEFVAECSELPLIPCHRASVTQVLLNLVANSVRAIAEASHPRDEQITIRTVLLHDCIQIVVRDTGNGISPEIRSRVFDPFFSTQSVGGGRWPRFGSGPRDRRASPCWNDRNRVGD